MFNFILEKLWVTIRPHHNRVGAEQQVNAVVHWPGRSQARWSSKDVSKLVEQALQNVVSRGAVKVTCAGRGNTMPLDGMIKPPERYGLGREISQYWSRACVATDSPKPSHNRPARRCRSRCRTLPGRCRQMIPDRNPRKRCVGHAHRHARTRLWQPSQLLRRVRGDEAVC
jgi:hypothetical protein